MAKQNNSFEDKLRSRYEGYQPQPPEGVWDEVYKRINRKRRRRIFLFLLPMMIALSVAGYYLNDFASVGESDARADTYLEEVPLKTMTEINSFNAGVTSMEPPKISLRETSSSFLANNPDNNGGPAMGYEETHIPERLSPLSKVEKKSPEPERFTGKLNAPSIPSAREVTDDLYESHNYVVDIFLSSGVNYAERVRGLRHSSETGNFKSPYYGLGMKFGQEINPRYSWHSGFSIEWQQHPPQQISADRSDDSFSRPASGGFQEEASPTFEHEQFSTMNFSIFGALERKLPRNFYLKVEGGLYHSRVVRTTDDDAQWRFDNFDKINAWAGTGGGYTFHWQEKAFYLEASGQYFYPSLWNKNQYDVPVRLQIRSGMRYSF